MQDLPLHRKYRPQDFDEIIGNKSTIISLKSVVEKEFPPTSYLLQGPRGCGKTTIARILASIFEADPEKGVFEYDIGQTGGVADADKILSSIRFKPRRGKVKVYILDECHDSSVKFQTRLLKTLEEPPKNVYFILCTTEPQKLLGTVRSRCTTYEVRSLGLTEINKLLRNVIIEEERRRFPKEAYQEISFAADGIPRDALKILDAVIDIKDSEELLNAIKDFSLEKKEVLDLFNALLNKTKWKDMAVVLKGLDEDPERIRYAVLTRMSNLLLSGKSSERAFMVIEEFKNSFIYTKKAGLVQACYAICHM